MSQENVEALRWMYGEWAKGDLWALREIADPNIEWEWSEGLATLSGGPRVYRGLDEIGASTREWLAAWDSYWMTAEEFIDAGARIVVPFRLSAVGKGTDIKIEQRAFGVWTMRDGRAIRVRFYEDRAEALEAAGLSE
jgi:ketosteroid isomerase-like protein